MDSEMDKVWFLDQVGFASHCLLLFVPTALFHCLLPLAWTMAELYIRKHTHLSVVGQNKQFNYWQASGTQFAVFFSI